MRGLTTDLDATEVGQIVSSLSVINNEKINAEKDKKSKKKKPKKKFNRDLVEEDMVRDKYDEFDNFM